jgi:large-conductance mechanosensitive channel
VSVEVRIIWYQSLALKSGLPFVSCYHSIVFFRFCSYSLFFVFVLCTKLKKKKKKKKKKRKKKEKKRRSDTEAPS